MTNCIYVYVSIGSSVETLVRRLETASMANMLEKEDIDRFPKMMKETVVAVLSCTSIWILGEDQSSYTTGETIRTLEH